MREHKLRMQRAPQTRQCRHRAQYGTDGKQERGGDIETNRSAKPRGKRLFDLAKKRIAMPGDHSTHHQRPDNRQGIELRHEILQNHARHQQHNTAVKCKNTCDLNAAGRIRDLNLHERFGEVLTPDQNRIRNQPQSHHMHNQPAALGDKAMHQNCDNNAKHPVRYRFRCAAVPTTSTGGTLSNLLRR